MSDWLIGLSERRKTNDEIFQDTIDDLSPSELRKLAHDVDPLSVPTRIDFMQIKIAEAVHQGRELAHEREDLEKIAFLPALAAGAARLAGGGALKSIAGGVAKDMAISAAGNKIMGALKPAAPAASAAGEVAGGFKYAALGNMLQRAAAYTVKNPGTALTAAGALGGALMAPRDPQTGQKQYLRGAVMGGGAAAGINAISNGAIANKMRSSVMNRNNPILGDRVRQYAMDASAAAKGKARGGVTANGAAQYAKTPAPAVAPQESPVPTTAAAPVTAAPVPVSTPAPAAQPYMGGPTMRGPASGSAHTSGPMMGAVKLAEFVAMSPAEQILCVAHLDALEKKANRQSLTYDPSTKTFTRHHLTDEMANDSPHWPSGNVALDEMGVKPFRAGHKEEVRNSATGMHHFGTPEYVNARIDGVEARNPGWAATKPVMTPTAQTLPPIRMDLIPPARQGIMNMPASRKAAVPPPIPAAARKIPGAMGGVAGIGAAAAQPTGIMAAMGKYFARK